MLTACVLLKKKKSFCENTYPPPLSPPIDTAKDIFTFDMKKFLSIGFEADVVNREENYHLFKNV